MPSAITFTRTGDPSAVTVGNERRCGLHEDLAGPLGASGGPFEIDYWARSGIGKPATIYMKRTIPLGARAGTIKALEAIGWMQTGTITITDVPDQNVEPGTEAAKAFAAGGSAMADTWSALAARAMAADEPMTAPSPAPRISRPAPGLAVSSELVAVQPARLWPLYALITVEACWLVVGTLAYWWPVLSVFASPYIALARAWAGV